MIKRSKKCELFHHSAFLCIENSTHLTNLKRNAKAFYDLHSIFFLFYILLYKDSEIIQLKNIFFY